MENETIRAKSGAERDSLEIKTGLFSGKQFAQPHDKPPA